MAQQKRKPNGPVAAAFLAAGIGCFTLGLMTTAAAASAGVGSALNWSPPVGPLAGKTGVAVIVWLIAWALLGSRWRDRDVPFSSAFRWTMILVAIGFLFTFPLFFELFH